MFRGLIYVSTHSVGDHVAGDSTEVPYDLILVRASVASQSRIPDSESFSTVLGFNAGMRMRFWLIGMAPG